MWLTALQSLTLPLRDVGVDISAQPNGVRKPEITRTEWMANQWQASGNKTYLSMKVDESEL